MAKKLVALMFMAVLAFPLSTALFSQDAPMKMAKEKEAKWEGNRRQARCGQVNPDRSQNGWWHRDDCRV